MIEHTSPDILCRMYNLELPTRVLLEIADVAGLVQAFEQRKELAIPMLHEVERITTPDAASHPLSRDDEEDLKNLLARGKRLKRTLKGFQEVARHFQGTPRGLEAIGLDRVKQAHEELRRMTAEFQLILQDLDKMLLKAACKITVGCTS